MKPSVSVIIPVRNGANYIQEALNHIHQQGTDIEIIVVDDASTDNTADIAVANNCILMSNSSCQGPVVAKNKALSVATGDYIMFHDHDDILADDAISTLLQAMDRDVMAVMARVADFHSPELTDEQRLRLPIKAQPYHGLFTGAILIRRTAFDVIGPFPENITAGEIIDWEHRMQKNGMTIKKIDNVTCHRRIHTANYGTTNREKEFKDYAALLRARIKSNMK